MSVGVGVGVVVLALGLAPPRAKSTGRDESAVFRKARGMAGFVSEGGGLVLPQAQGIVAVKNGPSSMGSHAVTARTHQNGHKAHVDPSTANVHRRLTAQPWKARLFIMTGAKLPLDQDGTWDRGG